MIDMALDYWMPVATDLAKAGASTDGKGEIAKLFSVNASNAFLSGPRQHFSTEAVSSPSELGSASCPICSTADTFLRQSLLLTMLLPIQIQSVLASAPKLQSLQYQWSQSAKTPDTRSFVPSMRSPKSLLNQSSKAKVRM